MRGRMQAVERDTREDSHHHHLTNIVRKPETLLIFGKRLGIIWDSYFSRRFSYPDMRTAKHQLTHGAVTAVVAGERSKGTVAR